MHEREPSIPDRLSGELAAASGENTSCIMDMMVRAVIPVPARMTWYLPKR